MHIFLPSDQFSSAAVHDTGTSIQVKIDGNDHHHLTKVMRGRVGDTVVVLDGRGNAFEATLVTIERHHTLAVLNREVELALPPEPPVHLTVAQALGKGDKFEAVIQHGTEVGASAFLPLLAERCVVDLPEARVPDRIARWHQIAKGAAEQSHRRLIPTILAPMRAKTLLMAEQSATLLLHTDPSATPLHHALSSRMASTDQPPRLILAVGPEGGWSHTEVIEATRANIPIVSLGPHVLRTETAALVAISQILYHFALAGSIPDQPGP